MIAKQCANRRVNDPALCAGTTPWVDRREVKVSKLKPAVMLPVLQADRLARYPQQVGRYPMDGGFRRRKVRVKNRAQWSVDNDDL